MEEKKPPKMTKARKRIVEIGSEQKYMTDSKSTAMTGVSKDSMTGVGNGERTGVSNTKGEKRVRSDDGFEHITGPGTQIPTQES